MKCWLPAFSPFPTVFLKEFFLVVKQLTDINCGPFKEKNETSLNFTVLVFLQYVISSLMHKKFWFAPKNFDRNQWYFILQKDFQRRKLIIFFFFPPLTVLQVGHTVYLRTPIDTSRCPLTPQDALCIVKKSFILFYLINYHEVRTFVVCITVSHRRTYKFYNSY